MKNADSAAITFVQDIGDQDDGSDFTTIILGNESTQDIKNALEIMQDEQVQNGLDLNIDELISYLKPMLYNANIGADAKDALTYYILSSFDYDPPMLASDYEIYINICDFFCNEGQDIEHYNAEYLIDFLVDILSDDQFFCRYANIFSQFILRILLYDQVIEFDQLDKPLDELMYKELLNFINSGEDQSVTGAESELIQPSSITDIC